LTPRARRERLYLSAGGLLAKLADGEGAVVRIVPSGAIDRAVPAARMRARK
jgi:hypothetical protein